jgi:hypothetical protein
MQTNQSHHDRQAACKQVQRRRCTALVIHSHTGTISVKDTDGHWHRHLEQIPQRLFLDLPPKQRSRITKTEITLGRPLIEDSKLIVVLDRRPKKRRVSTPLAQSNALQSNPVKPFQTEMNFDGQNGENY